MGQHHNQPSRGVHANDETILLPFWQDMTQDLVARLCLDLADTGRVPISVVFTHRRAAQEKTWRSTIDCRAWVTAGLLKKEACAVERSLMCAAQEQLRVQTRDAPDTALTKVGIVFDKLQLDDTHLSSKITNFFSASTASSSRLATQPSSARAASDVPTQCSSNSSSVRFAGVTSAPKRKAPQNQNHNRAQATRTRTAEHVHAGCVPHEWPCDESHSKNGEGTAGASALGGGGGTGRLTCCQVGANPQTSLDSIAAALHVAAALRRTSAQSSCEAAPYGTSLASLDSCEADPDAFTDLGVDYCDDTDSYPCSQ